MKATLTYDLRNEKESICHSAALRITQLSGIIEDVHANLKLVIEGIKEKTDNHPTIEEVLGFLEQAIMTHSFTDIVFRTYDGGEE